MIQKRFSLYFILGLIIVLIGTFSVIIISIYEYTTTKKYLEDNIHHRTSDSMEKIKYLIAPYIESYSLSEYENIVENEMKNRHIYAIIIKDYHMGRILGNEFVQSGKIRDQSWNIISFKQQSDEQKKILQKAYVSLSENIYNQEGSLLATIEIFGSDHFMKTELRKVINESIISILGVSIVLVIFSFLLIHRVLIRPLEDIITTIVRNSQESVSLKPIPKKGFKELYQLSETINKMIESINLSHEKLSELNKNLNQKVEEKTHELQHLNQSLEIKIQEELEKGKQKDILLHNQSRFASMGEMIGNIAHQWRQPLNALSITIQKMQRYYELGRLDEETLHKSIEKSTKLIQKMSSTIDDFMGFFREDKVKIEFDINEAIDETLSLLEASIKNNFIQLEFHKSPLPTSIEGYKGEFTQVILNIISNAKDALKQNDISNPTIIIKVVKEDDFVSIFIEDNAGGVPNEIIQKIFDPYFTTKEDGKGTGIGLYMSKIIVENNMGGTLQVYNKEAGACFEIRFECDKERKK